MTRICDARLENTQQQEALHCSHHTSTTSFSTNKSRGHFRLSLGVGMNSFPSQSGKGKRTSTKKSRYLSQFPNLSSHWAHGRKRRHNLEALAVDDRGALDSVSASVCPSSKDTRVTTYRLVVLGLGDPHLLEGRERGENRTTDPNGVLWGESSAGSTEQPGHAHSSPGARRS
jgi:hypothetical protein